MKEQGLSQKSCGDIYNVCHVFPLHSGGAWGLVAGAVLKDPSGGNIAGRAIVHQYDPGKNPNLTIVTIDDAAGLYIMTCPRPPCGKGPLS